MATLNPVRHPGINGVLVVVLVDTIFTIANETGLLHIEKMVTRGSFPEGPRPHAGATAGACDAA